MIRLFTFIAAIALMLKTPALAGEKNIRLTVQTFSLSHTSLTELMDLAGRSDPQIHEQTIAMAHKGNAKLLDTIIVTGLQGNHSEAESVQEYIFPTEFDPPELMGSSGPTNGNFYNGGVPKGSGIPSCLTPTAYETRLLGTTLSTSSVLLQNGTISSQVGVTFDSLVRLDNHFKHQDNWGKVNLQMPVFDSWRSSRHWRRSDDKFLNLKSGVFTLFATHRPSNTKANTFKDSRVLIFVRADALSPEP